MMHSRCFALFFALACGSTTLVLAATSEAQAQTASAGAVLVELRPGELSLPSGADWHLLDEASQISPGLRSFLDSCGVHSAVRAYPSLPTGVSSFVNRTGQMVRIPDRSNAFFLELGAASATQAFLERARARTEFLVADPVPAPQLCAVYPNDSLFAAGGQWGFNNFGQSDSIQAGTPGMDINAPNAWTKSTGAGGRGTLIALLDAGANSLHPDLAGKFVSFSSASWNDDPSDQFYGHGFLVAGIAAAQGGNGIGMAGLDWGDSVYSQNISGFCKYPSTYLGDAVLNATRAPYFTRKVLNHSYMIRTCADDTVLDDPLVGEDFAVSYMANDVNVAAMGNNHAGEAQLPASYTQFNVIAVGGVDNRGQYDQQECYGLQMDVVAPDVRVRSTFPADQYKLVTGTSFAAPAVAGIAALMLDKNPNLYNDDVKELIRLSAKPLQWPDSVHYGQGLVDARRALELLDAPNVLVHGVATQGAIDLGNDYDYSTWVPFQARGLAGFGSVQNQVLNGIPKHEVHMWASFGSAFQTPPTKVWGRGVDSQGYLWWGVPAYQVGWCQPIDGTVTAQGCSLRTYVYHVGFAYSTLPEWWPVPPSQVRCAWSAFAVAPDTIPSAVNSFFVPQAGPLGGPVEGDDAIKFFHVCPNNDGGSSLPISQHCRVQITVKDSRGVRLAGVPANDIYLLLNGGTGLDLQGFVNEGADSIIANSRWNPSQACPDVRTFYADGPTDASGITRITFTGGTGARDPSRKWGHYDSDMPVFVRGVKIPGQITSTNTTPYTLAIKNFDFEGGLGRTLNAGEAVSSVDFDAVVAAIGHADSENPLYWWRDFDNSGSITSTDFNIFIPHNNHDCSHPDNP